MHFGCPLENPLFSTDSEAVTSVTKILCFAGHGSFLKVFLKNTFFSGRIRWVLAIEIPYWPSYRCILGEAMLAMFVNLPPLKLPKGFT